MDYTLYIDKGGLVVQLLIGLFIFGMSIMLWKFITYALLLKSTEGLKKALTIKTNKKKSPALVEHNIDCMFSQLEMGLTSVKIIASISPLLGLLGTVIGIFFSFSSIATNGLGDPSYFAEGISMALITTIAGLIVAVPHYIGYNYLVGMLDKVELRFRGQILNDDGMSDA